MFDTIVKSLADSVGAAIAHQVESLIPRLVDSVADRVASRVMAALPDLSGLSAEIEAFTAALPDIAGLQESVESAVAALPAAVAAAVSGAVNDWLKGQGGLRLP